MVERLTEKSIKVIMLAQDESRRLGHSFVCTEQILLGTLRLGTIPGETSIAAKVLKSEKVTLEQARIEVEKIIGRGSDFAIDRCYRFTSKADRAINLAGEEAERLGHNYLDAGHLMLGMLCVEDGIGLQVLANLGADAAKIRDMIIRRLGENT